MIYEVPDHLKATRNLLIRSLPFHPDEKAPPVPPVLMQDFVERFGSRQVAPASKVVEAPWLARIGRLFASPSFGLAAAAVVVVGLVVPQLVNRARNVPETFRGAGSPSVTDHVSRIVFVGEGAEFVAAVRDSEVYEPASLVSAHNLSGAMAEPGPKVVVDFNAGTLSVFSRAGELTFTAALPKSAADLPAVIAAALTQP